MVSHTSSKIKIFGGLSVVSVLTLLAINPVMASGSATLRTVVDEMLTVSLEQTTVSTAESDGLARNKVGLIIDSNNGTGFTASMTTVDATGALANAASNNLSIPLLDNNTSRSAFPSNAWGYSINDTDAGDSASTYRTIATTSSTTPSYIASSSSNSVSKDIFFGAKARVAGSYSNSVVISVVTGVVTDDPINSNDPVTPDDPVNPSDDPTPNDNNGSYISDAGGSSNGVTVGRTTTNTSTTSKTTTQITKGDTTDSYSDPQGVRNSVTSSTGESSPLAIGLAVTAGVAAVAGIGFLFAAKRRKSDDEDDYDY